jgi:hypothetical protein
MEKIQMNEYVRCILCQEPCIEIQVLKDDVVEGYDDRKITLKGYYVPDVELVTMWRDRVICRKCWKDHKQEVITELWKRSQDCIKYRLPATKSRITKAKQELVKEEKYLVKLQQQIKDKNPGLKNFHKLTLPNKPSTHGEPKE